MKNIHVLPTENESRIRYNRFNKVYELCEFPKYHTDIKSTHNICITSDEEIKKGDWYISTLENEVHKATKKTQNIMSAANLIGTTTYKNTHFKIILTDNDLLIDDGVQAIDDEFLEWFIKNPSCEEIEVVKFCKNQDDCPSCLDIYAKQGLCNIGYKIIIIPKEEPKQETQGYICPQTKKQCNDECCVSAKDCHLEASIGVLSEPKQETLEEAAEKWVFENNSQKWSNNDNTSGDNYGSFIAGAKWQQERMYSEMDIVLILSKFRDMKMIAFSEWFEKFRKK